MKNTIKFFGIIAVAAVIGFSFIACGEKADGGPDSALNGTWANSDGKMVLNNGNISFFEKDDEVVVEFVRGTYSTSGNNITVTFTQVSGAIMGNMASAVGLSPSQFYTQQQVKNAVITYLTGNGSPQVDAEAFFEKQFGELFSELLRTHKGTYSVSGNKLTLTMEGEKPEVLTKQP